MLSMWGGWQTSAAIQAVAEVSRLVLNQGGQNASWYPSGVGGGDKDSNSAVLSAF